MNRLFLTPPHTAPGVRPAWRLAQCALMMALLAGCAVGPDYVVPAQDTGVGYKASTMPGWSPAEPSDHVSRGAWWAIYGDSVLNDLMTQLAAGNQTVAQAEANYRAAVATLRNTRAGLFPTVGLTSGATRSGSGGGTSSTGDGTFSGTNGHTNQYSLQGNVSWEADIWGRVRRGVEADDAAALGTASTLASTLLSQQSTLAQTYFQLRITDELRILLDRTIASFERSLRTTQNRYDAGLAPRVDVAVAQTQLESARASLLDLVQQRALLENAIALLLGQPPSRFDLPQIAFMQHVPDIPVGLPSGLLERRPDVAAAERQAAAANARIGVAQAAWFPSLTLSASGGWRSSEFAEWITAPARFWTLGPQLAATLFDAGARRAQIDQARAQYDAQAAAYRQTVLTALREVEDYMATLSVQSQSQVVRLRALEAARLSLRLTRNQYDEGLISYLDVATVETSALNAERDALNVVQARLVASVQLIAALGGGWDTSRLADPLAPWPGTSVSGAAASDAPVNGSPAQAGAASGTSVQTTPPSGTQSFPAPTGTSDRAIYTNRGMADPAMPSPPGPR